MAIRKTKVLRWLPLWCVLGTLACGSGSETNAVPPVSVASSGGSAGMGGSGGSGGSTSSGGGACTIDADCDDGFSCTTDRCSAAMCAHTATNAACDNGMYCDGTERCDPPNGDATTGCAMGAGPCDDAVSCTVDACDEATDSCTSTPDDTSCDDGAFCTGTESCDPANGDPLTGCAAGSGPCNDAIGCTTDSCNEMADTCANTPDNTVCNDSAYCNGTELCDPPNGDPMSGCTTGTSPCSDAIDCTTDTCDEMGDTCMHTPDNALCVDTAFCNGTETCDPLLGDPLTGCLGGTSPCDDGGPCTVDVCNEGTDVCSHTPNNALCQDGKFCTGSEWCDSMGQCQTTPISCLDGKTCTNDFCDVNLDYCVHVPVNASCDNGTFCDGQELCSPNNPFSDPVTGCMNGTAVNCSDAIVCTVDSCNENLELCDHVPNNTACDDGLFCNGAEICVGGQGCQAGNAIVCNDGLTCTSESCNENLNGCFVTLLNHSFCDDGLYCNGNEICNPNKPPPGTGCDAGSNVTCTPDAYTCTDETCDEFSLSCISTPNNANCAMGELCLPGSPGSDPLTGCKPAAQCMNNTQCNDNNLCNGVETCTMGICTPGTPLNCNDGIGCTLDGCDPMLGCQSSNNNAYCDDGQACTGAEICDPPNGDPVTGCVGGTSIVCNDNKTCTYDVCTEPNGICQFLPQNSDCDDGTFCNGPEQCDPTDPMSDPLTGCIAGSPPSCVDGVNCTVDSCSIIFDVCLHVPNNSLCTICGESCDSILGCGNYCVPATCGSKTYQCGDCVDNDIDCGIDTGGDIECLGPCQNNEQGYKGNIPGQNNAPCKSDCYFDGDTGSGNDDCYWSHKCDPYEVSPNWDPEGPACAYDPNANIPGTQMTCAQAQVFQSAQCLGYCGPLVPNGCDCFGCCSVPNLTYAIWLGSVDQNDNGTCNSTVLSDPTKCRPCTQVNACLNTCEECEICLGKPVIPPTCTCQQCPNNVQLCGPPCGTPCQPGYFCNSGCCVLNPG